MSNSNFLANESVSVTSTKLSTWDNTTATDEKIPANVPTNPDGSAHVQALTDAQLRASPIAATITNANVEISNDVGNPIPVNGTVALSGTPNVAVTSSVLPTGAATSLLQTTLNASVSSIDSKDFATETTLAAIKAKTDNIDVALSTRTKPTDAQNIRALVSTDQVTIANASLPVTGAFFQATQPVSIAASVPVTGPLTDAQLRAAVVPVSLASTTITNFPATQATSNILETASTGTITSVTNAITSFSVLASNANRKGFVIHNDSTTTVFVAFAATSSATAFTIRLTSQASYISNSLPIYRGAISGIASAANGALRITELT
jgi:hypothetical protein